MDMTTFPRKLWEHPDPKSTEMWKFMQNSNRRYSLNLENFQDLWKWSVEHRSDFYSQLWDHQSFIHEGTYTQVVDESVPISGLPRWFEGIRLNWAENWLWSRQPNDPPGFRGTKNKDSNAIAVTEVREGSSEVSKVTWGELRRRAGELAGALYDRGVRRGDRVVVVGSHSVQTFLICMATSWFGAIFSSSSTDMGVSGLLQRTTQIDPKFVFFDDAALYNGKVTDLRENIQGMMEGMKQCKSFESVVMIKRFDKPYDTSHIPNTERLEDFLSASKATTPPQIERVGFMDPLVVYYSSGTTGIAKAIVHGVGPLLMNLKKEGVLHRQVKPHHKALQYTTTGWIMLLASYSPLLMGCQSVFYDGSPFMPDLKILLRLVQEHGVNHLGTSPRWMAELMKGGIVPREEGDLTSLITVTSTGMVLPEQMFEWFYDVAFPKTAQLANVSGGTDIAGSFGLENPISPLYVGGCQGPCLGVSLAVYDHDATEGSSSKPLPDGTPGDLVAPIAFPNVPLFLWGDPSPAPGPKYQGAYFSKFGSVWEQGDFCTIHPLTGALILLGRSDGVLNPSGVRFGSADIYAVIERCFPHDVSESLCVGQRRPSDLDESVVLFLMMKPGVALAPAKVKDMKSAIARELTKRHVPKYIFEVPEIPTTVNGKKVELPVKQIISGKRIKPSGTLLNPGCLEYFYRFQRIEEVAGPRAKL